MAGKSVDFVVVLEDGVRKRHRHLTQKSRVTYFAVQLEVLFMNEWKVAVRYDCSHGVSHMHKYDIMGQGIRRVLKLGFESALTFSDWDINENWQRYRDDFLKGAV